ncbi:MAG: hypothetical protein KIT72_02560 [Polyangiaceae bacterium]|nr:hypothetical protein [Polyangiaceae bacterium]MCW5789281.1 hypothetical protein [Polyangiaceae bacterium]
MDWHRALAKAEESGDDASKWAIAVQFLEAVGQAFLQGHQVVQRRTDGEAELRGSWHGHPARAKLDVSFFSLEWEMQATNPSGHTLYFHWDMDAVPPVGQFTGEAASAWGDADEEKVFLGKGYYVEIDLNEDGRDLAAYELLPSAVRETMATYIIGDRIPRLYVYAGGGLLLGFTDEVHIMPDPLNTVGRGAWLLGQIAWGLSQVDVSKLPAQGAQVDEQALGRHTCRYCASLFLLIQSHACPNCGAAAS